MEWYYIVAIVVGALFLLFALTFTMFITNADMKLVEKIYDKLIALHDAKQVDEEL